MEYCQNKINDYLFNNFIKEFPEPIINKVEYLLTDGKRLRPILFLIFSDINNEEYNINRNISGETTETDSFIKEKTIIANNIKKNLIYDLGCIIETLHNLSLVLDDMPSMDNDLIRRNKPTFHLKFVSEYTNFFVYYLFNKIGLKLKTIFEYGINNTNIDFFKDAKYIFEYNLSDLIDGQYTDLNWNKYLNNGLQSYDFTNEKEIILMILSNIKNYDINPNTKYQLMKNIDLNMKKTASLFNLSICCGFIMQLWNKDTNQENFKEYSNVFQDILIWSYIFGYVFQISDDILDVIPDINSNNPNICSIIGLENSKLFLDKCIIWLRTSIMDIYNSFNPIVNANININAINEIIDMIANRQT